jgi:hypothetical protein
MCVCVDFAIIDLADQAKLLRYAESQPRMLASAALWYNMEKEEFDHYYYCSKPTPERPDYVKYLAVSQFARCIRPLEMDSIETALLASLVVIATGEFLNVCSSSVLLWYKYIYPYIDQMFQKW